MSSSTSTGRTFILRDAALGLSVPALAYGAFAIFTPRAMPVATTPGATTPGAARAIEAMPRLRTDRAAAPILGALGVGAALVALGSPNARIQSAAIGAAVGSIGASAFLYRRAQLAAPKPIIETFERPPPPPMEMQPPPATTPAPTSPAPTPPAPAPAPATPPPAPGFEATPVAPAPSGATFRIGDPARVPDYGAFIYERADDASAMLPLSGPFTVVVQAVDGPWARVALTSAHPAPPTWRTFWIKQDRLFAAPGSPTPGNVLGCTPLSGVVPPAAIRRAELLLALEIGAAEPTRRATYPAVRQMRELADDLAYCGAALGAQPGRDALVTQLRERATSFEAALRTTGPQLRFANGNQTTPAFG